MKNVFAIILSTIVVGFVVNLAMSNVDPIYNSIQKSYQSANKKDSKYPLKSVEYHEFKLLLGNHWKQSGFISQLEDIFYPIRKWSKNPKESIYYQAKNDRVLSQLKSIRNNEKATKVRAKKAYFNTKRKNFREKDLNNDFNEKLIQWKSNFLSVLDLQVSIKNTSYNLIVHQFAIFGISTFSLFFIFKINWFVSIGLSFILLISLLIGSNDVLVRHGVPFHLLLILFIAWLKPIKSKYDFSNKIVSFLTIIIPVIIGLSTIKGAMIGALGILLIMIFPKLKGLLLKVCSIHPFGFVGLIHEKNNINRQGLIKIFLILTSVIAILNQFGYPILFTSPVIYFGELGIILTALLLMLTCGSISIGKNSVFKPRDIFVALISGSIINYFSQPFFSDINQWSFTFVWHPIIMWGAIIIILARGLGVFKQS